MEKALKEKLPNGKFQNVKDKHRKIMMNVKGKGNRSTEVRFRAALVNASISGWKLNFKKIKGSPDFFFPEEKIAIFIDGCFWHGCPKCGHIPLNNRDFWDAKLSRNKERDKKTTALLRRQGFSVLRFWEHDVQKSIKECINKVCKKITYRRNVFNI